MTRILAVIAGFIAGGAILTGTAVAVDRAANPAVAPMTMSGMMTTASPASGMTELTIQHVQKGCHVWSDGSRRAASMRLKLSRGARLRILDQDIDPHGLVQVAGPKLAFRGHMMMGQSQTITFTKPGLYQLKSKVVEMGPMMEVKTIGPDNTLRLTVSVR